MTQQADQQQLIQSALQVKASIAPRDEINTRVEFLCSQMLETGQHGLVLGNQWWRGLNCCGAVSPVSRRKSPR